MWAGSYMQGCIDDWDDCRRQPAIILFSSPSFPVRILNKDRIYVIIDSAAAAAGSFPIADMR
jgi:hypothetical protein